MGYRANAISGFKWVGSYRFLLRVLSIIRTAILARLLSPAQFGVFGVAAIVLGLLEMFTETGINVFLVQQSEQHSLKHYLNTAWVISILRGGLIAFCLVVFSPLVIAFFRSPASLPILLLMALIPLARGFINPAIVSFQRDLAFKKEFWYRTILMLVDAAVAITLALVTRSAISLAWGMIASAFFEVFLSFVIVQLRPHFIYIKSQAKEIISHGKWITSAGIFNYFADNTPDITIGRLMPNVSLGYYQMAAKLSLIPFKEAAEILNRVSFPVYTKFADDNIRLVRALKQNFLIVVSFIIPIVLGIFFFATPITRLLLGDQWLPVIPLMRILSLAGAILVMGAITDPIYLAKKHQDYLSHVNTIRLILVIILTVPATYFFGITGSAYALLISLSIILPVRFFYAFKSLATPQSV